MAFTPGMSTSEFLMACVPMVIGLVLIILGTLKGDPNLVAMGAAMLTGTSAAYGVSRGIAKAGNKLPADPAAAARLIASIK